MRRWEKIYLLPAFLPLLLSGVEKKNDDFRQLFHQKINRWDASTSLLLVEKCQEALDSCEWQTCNYVKRNKNFWCEGGKQESAKKVPRISAVEQPREDVQMSWYPLMLPKNLRRHQLTSRSMSWESWKSVTLFNSLMTFGLQPNLPKKPRKCDLIYKITEIANPRSNYLQPCKIFEETNYYWGPAEGWHRS